MMSNNINTNTLEGEFTFQCINSETNEILYEGKEVINRWVY